MEFFHYKILGKESEIKKFCEYRRTFSIFVNQ